MTMALALRPASMVALERVRAASVAISEVIDVSFPETEAAERAAGALLREVETLRRAAEAERKAEKAPHLAAGRAVDAAFADVLDPLERVSGILRRRLSEVATRREDARRFAVQAVSALALSGDAAGANEALALANDPVFAPVVASGSGVSEKISWEIESCDVEAMPREYLAPDMAKIRLVASSAPAGVDPKIPGVVFRRVVTHVVRSVGR